MLVGAIDLRFQIAVREQLHRALQVADPPQDVAADIEPDEQYGSDQGEGAERLHDHGRQRNLFARLKGGSIGLAPNPIHQLLHADAEADIELAGFIENGLAVIGGVQFLLADLEYAGLALAQRHQARGGGEKRRGRRTLGQQIEILLHAALRGAEFLVDGFQRTAAVGRQCGYQVERHQIAAGNDLAELVDDLLSLGCFFLVETGGAEDGIELGLGGDHHGTGGPDESRLGGARGAIKLLVLGRGLEALACRAAEALDHLVDVLDGLGEGFHHSLVGAERGDLAELGHRTRLGFLHLAGALFQRLFVLRGQQRRSLAGKAGALGGELQAGREAGNIPSTQFDHRPAEMPQHHAGAGADDDGHAGDHGEGGEQAAPDAPLRAQKAKSRKFADAGKGKP